MLVKEFYRTKGLEDNTYNLPDSLNQLTDIPSKNAKKKLLFLKDDCFIGNHSHSFVWKKGKRFATTVIKMVDLIII